MKRNALLTVIASMLIASLIMLCSCALLPESDGLSNIEQEKRTNGDVKSEIAFGSYPQTKVTDSTLMSTLTAKAGTLPTSENSQSWTSYGYYISGSLSNYMWYIDVTDRAAKYRGVYFTSYRPYYTTNSSDTGNSYQDDNGYNTSTVYWFKYEPIKWRILEESDGYAIILADMIIDSREYYPTESTSLFRHNGGTGYANNYALSNIRKWLNDDFYNTAFGDLQKALIQEINVDNGARSTNPNNNAAYYDCGNNSYACADTNDKVWLLSEQEVTKTSYGFATSQTAYDIVRQKKTTNYAQCQGVWISDSSRYVDNGCWWLRSPYCYNGNYAWFVNSDGRSSSNYSVHVTTRGVVPALKIKLSDVSDDSGTAGGEGASSLYTRDGSYIYFGSYPQTKVTNGTLKSALTDKAGTLPTSENSQGWTSYGYYISGSLSNYMWYIDLEEGDYKYRGVYFTSYRPHYTTNSSGIDNGQQNSNGYNTSTVHWFKYEPIKWRVLEESGGYAHILADMVIDSQQYDYDGNSSYTNNYANSTIRAWLNDTFYNTAFTDLQKSLIQTVVVDNSARSTNPDNNAAKWNNGENSYVCVNTNDKVWLLSQQEVTKAIYGFAASSIGTDTVRQKKTTDYARCQGAFTYVGSSNGYWWLRSPSYADGSSAWNIDGGGSCRNYYGSANGTWYGVVPALKIKLSDVSDDSGTAGGEGASSLYTRDGSYIYFGSYPQTKVTNGILKSTLTAKAGTLPTSENSQGWTSYGYYIDGSANNYMWYIDVVEGDCKYRGVYFTTYRPHYTTNSVTIDRIYQEDNGYKTSTVYWFKYEQIKWLILEESGGYAIILADMIIDSQQYDYDGNSSYTNNYANSTIRAWLNDTFYNTAFTDLQKSLIQTVVVDNSARSTNSDSNAVQYNGGNNSNACTNTNDKIWLLSQQEVTKESYGFASIPTDGDSVRQKKTTDYAQCQGAYTSGGDSGAGNGYWWLRSPYCSSSLIAWSVHYDGSNYCHNVLSAFYGVVPALKIKI